MAARLYDMEFRPRASGDQFSALLEFMQSHGDLARPEPGALGRLKADQLWQDLAKTLNAIGGGVKRTPDKWKKVWADWKSKTKKKALNIRRQASGTGARLSCNIRLSAMEKRVLGLIGVRVEGYPKIKEEPEQKFEVPLTEHEDSTSREDVDPFYGVASGSPPSPSLPAVPSPEPAAPSRPRRRIPTPSPSRPPTPLSTSVQHGVGAESVSSSSRRGRLDARRRRTLTPVDRVTREFVAVEQRRLQLEEKRERNEARRIDVEHERNVLLSRFLDIGEAMFQQYLGSSNSSTE